jgi:hypothetical protein
LKAIFKKTLSLVDLALVSQPFKNQTQMADSKSNDDVTVPVIKALPPPETQRAVVVKQFDADLTKSVQVVDDWPVHRPKPNSDQVLVRVEYSTLKYVEVGFPKGHMKVLSLFSSL